MFTDATPARLHRQLLRWRLGRLHARGQRRSAVTEAAEPSLLRLNQRLRQTSVDQNRNRLAHCPRRILLCTPPSLAAGVWFTDLHAGMRHAGVQVRLLAPGETVGAELLGEFRPDVLLSLDSDAQLRRIDLDALLAHKRAHGCLRLLVPTDNAPRAERHADAFCSLYEPEYFLAQHRALAEAGFPYISLPQSGNPLDDHMVEADRNQDYFYASVCTPERLALTSRNLRPILRDTHGDWAGEHWGFGEGPIRFSEMSRHYSSARIVLAPLVPRLTASPMELTHRVFEAAACGAFQLTTLSPITRRYFAENELVCAPTNDEYARVFFEWLPRRDERLRRAERAMVALYAAHTVFHRIEAFLAELQRLSSRF